MLMQLMFDITKPAGQSMFFTVKEKPALARVPRIIAAACKSDRDHQPH